MVEECGNCHMQAGNSTSRPKHKPPLHPIAVEGLGVNGALYPGEWFHDYDNHRGPNVRLASQDSGILPGTQCGACHTPTDPENAFGPEVTDPSTQISNDPHSVHREVFDREGCIRCHVFDDTNFNRSGNGKGGIAFTQGNATHESYGIANPINMNRVWDGLYLSTDRESDYTYLPGLGGLTENGTRNVTFSDGFEGEPADAGVADDWEVVSANGSNTVEVRDSSDYYPSQESPYNGSNSYYLGIEYTDSSQFIYHRPKGQPYGSPGKRKVSVALLSGDLGAYENGIGLILKEGNTTIVHLRVKSETILYHDGSQWQTLQNEPYPLGWVEIEVFDINPADDTYSVTWSPANYDGGTKHGLPMMNSSDYGWDSSQIGVSDGVYGDSDTSSGYVDDFKVIEEGGNGWNVYGSSESGRTNAFSCGDCHDQFHAEQAFAETGGKGIAFAFDDSPGSRKGPYKPVKDTNSIGVEIGLRGGGNSSFTCGFCHPTDAHAVHTNGEMNSRASFDQVMNVSDQSIITPGVLGAELCDECHTQNAGPNNRHIERRPERGLSGSPTDSHNRKPDLNANYMSGEEDCGFCHQIRD